MAIDVIMPQMGADMTEGTLVRWLKQVGDQVNRGEIIAEIETDKATVELEAFEAGILRKHVVPEGETVPVGQVIAILGDAGEAIGEDPERKPLPPVADRHSETSPAAAMPQSPRRAAAPIEGSRVRISPVARRIAADAGIEPSAITGTGPDGRVLRRDVEAAIASQAPAPERAPAAVPAPQPAPSTGPAAAPFELVPFTRMRQAIARRMSQSKQQQPHYYITLDIDMTAASAFRAQVNSQAAEDQRVSFNDLVVKACAIALGRHPRFNAEFTDDGIRVYRQINLAIGVALDDGLIAPAIIDVGSKSLGAIAREARDVANRARSGNLTAEEYSASTFTITNLGAFGVETLIGIINPPQSAILGVGSIMPQPVVVDGEVVVRQVMKIALSADHRVTDGAEGARFVKEIQSLLENPASLAL
ncbi:MAG: dihydrolipoamide acetyltransferase family protein [Dehalococcoidia bacterium]|nr:2-oxo acid dehydrogenase subunit E2 [Dehalococcoidia bacterium]MCB9485538.1 2-oxo acid dehydrogenase subunit E2 [Thermoflexaceae bacterium]